MRILDGTENDDDVAFMNMAFWIARKHCEANTIYKNRAVLTAYQELVQLLKDEVDYEGKWVVNAKIELARAVARNLQDL